MSRLGKREESICLASALLVQGGAGPKSTLRARPAKVALSCGRKSHPANAWPRSPGRPCSSAWRGPRPSMYRHCTTPYLHGRANPVIPAAGPSLVKKGGSSVRPGAGGGGGLAALPSRRGQPCGNESKGIQDQPQTCLRQSPSLMSRIR